MRMDFKLKEAIFKITQCIDPLGNTVSIPVFNSLIIEFPFFLLENQ
jgi:hypothetical protein